MIHIKFHYDAEITCFKVTCFVNKQNLFFIYVDFLSLSLKII